MKTGELVLIKTTKDDEGIAPAFIGGVFLSKCGERAIVARFVKGEINRYADVQGELLQNVILYENKETAESYVRSITEDCIAELFQKIVVPSKEEIKNDVVKKWYLYKKEILETASNIVKFADDGNEEAFTNRLKSICITKTAMFAIKSPILDGIHKQNGTTKWKINKSKDNLKVSLQAVELLEEIKKQDC